MRCSRRQYGFARRRMVTFCTYDGECFPFSRSTAVSRTTLSLRGNRAVRRLRPGRDQSCESDGERTCPYCRSPAKKKFITPTPAIPIEQRRYAECPQPYYSGAAQGQHPARRNDCLPPGSAAVHRQADRAVAEFRGAGGHCDGERAALDRDARGLGAADRDRRGVAGHQFLARRSRAGVRGDPG